MALGGNHATPLRNTYLWFYTQLDDKWDTLISIFLTHHFPRKSNDAGYPQPNGDAVIIVLAAGVFFHAMSKVLDYLKEIRDAVQKMATDKE